MTLTVAALLITRETEPALLTALLESLKSQTHPLNEALIVDNGSENVEETRSIAQGYRAKVIPLAHNRGFPFAVNLGIRELGADAVLVLNDDVTLERDAVKEMCAPMERNPLCGAVAPKTYLAQYPGFLDSIGIVVNERFSAYNRGIGEPDIGQYDAEEATFGVCFAAALIRRDIYLRLGGMDPSYFAYYEDVDYCYRMARAGFVTCTCPRAVVIHHHSHFWKQKPALRKYFLIQRNLLRTAVKHTKPRALARILFHRYLEHLNRFLRAPAYRWVTLAVLAVHFLEMPYWLSRRYLPRLPRRVTDHHIFRYSYGREPHFDPVRYRPEFTLANLAQAYSGLFELTQREDRLLKAEALKALKERSRTLTLGARRSALAKIVAGEPEIITRFADLLEEERIG
jgi:GT2 family glycosyltransferase